MSDHSTESRRHHHALRMKLIVRRPMITKTKNEQIPYDDLITDGNSRNHFVRLTPDCARRLRDIALSISVHPSSEQSLKSQRRWYIHHHHHHHHHHHLCSNEKNISKLQDTTQQYVESGIEFLPLAITFESSTVEIILYASYNGGTFLIDEDTLSKTPIENDFDGYIDVPECLLTDWINQSGTNHDAISSSFVTVQPLVYIDNASTLLVDPVSSEDWDILQLNAADLEAGRLLQQISVVYTGQVIQLIMSNGSKANLTVLPQNFERKEKSVWPTDTATIIGTRYPCYRLLRDTEIIITPKPQIPKHPLQYPLQLIPTRQDYQLFDPAMIQLSEELSIELISVQQGCVVIHPNTLDRLKVGSNCTTKGLFAIVQVVSTTLRSRIGGEINVKNNTSDDNIISATVQIIVSESIPEDHIALHPFVRLRIKGSIFTGRTLVTIKKFLAPIEITLSSTKIHDMIQTGEATLHVKRIQLRTPNLLSPWWIPTWNSVLDAYHMNSSSHDDSMNLVLNFGSICWRREIGLCRLDLVINDRFRNNGYEFIFNKQLLELGNEVKFDDHSEVIIIDETRSSRLLSTILPRRLLCLSPSILSMAKSALLRTSILLYGDCGCGKSFTSLLIAAVARLVRGDKCVYLDCKKLRDSHTIRMKTILTELEETFNAAYDLAPCVIILDDLDAIVPSFQSGSHADNSSLSLDSNPTEIDQSKLVSNVLLHLLHAQYQRVCVVVTAALPQSLSKFITSKGIFDHQTTVPKLNDNDRDILYRSFLQQSTDVAVWSKDSNFGRQTRSFRPRDLEMIAFRAMNYQSMHNQVKEMSLHEATSKVLEDFVPLSRFTSVINDKSEPVYKLCDIGGLSQPKADLISTIVRPSLYRQIYSHAKVRLPRGVLLFGFSGTGKSICVPALAHECGYPLITCRGPELLDKYIGASEAKIRALFAKAAAAAPSILFFDELDALAPRRGSDHTGVTDRIVNQLLTFLDGVEDVSDSVHGQTVYVIGATSRPDKVDPALLRPGRLEKHIFFGLSDDVMEVKTLVSKISERYTLDEQVTSAITSGTFVEEMASHNHLFRFFSAADYTSMFHVAQRMAVCTAIDAGHTKGAAKICSNHLLDAMISSRPSVSQSDYDRLFGIYMSFRQGKGVNSPEKNIEPILTSLK